MPTPRHSTPTIAHELVFRSLFHSGRALSFPCDPEGHVWLDGLTDRARGNYLYARALVGRDFTLPEVTASKAG